MSEKIMTLTKMLVVAWLFIFPLAAPWGVRSAVLLMFPQDGRDDEKVTCVLLEIRSRISASNPSEQERLKREKGPVWLQKKRKRTFLRALLVRRDISSTSAMRS